VILPGVPVSPFRSVPGACRRGGPPGGTGWCLGGQGRGLHGHSLPATRSTPLPRSAAETRDGPGRATRARVPELCNPFATLPQPSGSMGRAGPLHPSWWTTKILSGCTGAASPVERLPGLLRWLRIVSHWAGFFSGNRAAFRVPVPEYAPVRAPLGLQMSRCLSRYTAWCKWRAMARLLSLMHCPTVPP